jgi:hypothetical protein
VGYRRIRWLGLTLGVLLALPACSPERATEPVSVTTPSAEMSPAAASSGGRPSTPSTDKPRNDLKKGRVIRVLKAGSVKITVKYSLQNRVQQWSPGVAQPLTVSLTAQHARSGAFQAQTQKIYLARVTGLLEVFDTSGHLDSPNTLADRADVTPGFLVTSPTHYTQVFTLPALPARATTLTIDFRYEILLLQAGSVPRDFEKRTATDTLVISRP